MAPKSRKLILAGLLGLALFAGSGCSSIADITSEQRIFGGIRRVFEDRAPLKGGGSFGGASAEGIDLVFSAFTDVFLLPITVACAILRPAKVENAGKP